MLIKKNKIPGIACRVAASSNNRILADTKSWRSVNRRVRMDHFQDFLKVLKAMDDEGQKTVVSSQ